MRHLRAVRLPSAGEERGFTVSEEMVIPSDEAELLGAMVEGARSGLCVLSPEGVLLRVNRAALEILRSPETVVIGRHVRELSEATDLDWSPAAEVASSNLSVTVVQSLGDGRKLLVSATPVVSSEGTLRYVVFTVRDITAVGSIIRQLPEAPAFAAGHGRAARRPPVHNADLVLQSAAMRAVREQALQYAGVDSPIMLSGETGTGKGLFARLIHEASARSAGPFLEINCGAIPEGLVEAELFGYAKGAFTGADPRGKIGLLELADRGTLLLDEIADLPHPLQVKLLRFLEGGEVWPVGGLKPRWPSVRIISATNRELERMMAEGRFREDLYYRLAVLTLYLPPLREHPEDIAPLVDVMLSKLEGKLGQRRVFTGTAMRALATYSFPGNVRELWNLVERLAVTTIRAVIDIGDLPSQILQASRAVPGAGDDQDHSLRVAVRRFEAETIRKALGRFGTQQRAARHLGVTQSTIARKMKQYRLSPTAGPDR